MDTYQNPLITTNSCKFPRSLLFFSKFDNRIGYLNPDDAGCWEFKKSNNRSIFLTKTMVSVQFMNFSCLIFCCKNCNAAAVEEENVCAASFSFIFCFYQLTWTEFNLFAILNSYSICNSIKFLMNCHSINFLSPPLKQPKSPKAFLANLITWQALRVQ